MAVSAGVAFWHLFCTFAEQSPKRGSMFTDEDKEALLQAASIISDALSNIGTSFSPNDTAGQEILTAGDCIERGLNNVSRSIDRLCRCFEKE